MVAEAAPSRPSPGRRLVGLVRLIHPFPSILDGAVTGGLALLAGSDVSVAGRLGVAMLALQAAIGSTNDIVDEGRDRGRKRGKPIPAGVVSSTTARWVAAAAAALGLGLSAVSGPPTLLVAGVGLGTGLAYNLGLKGTIWSWLPFAIGLPLLPVYAWLGSVGRIPALLLVLIPVGALAAAGLAIANALADLERDVAAGRSTIATFLGAGESWRLGALLQAIVVVCALATAAAARLSPALLGALVAVGSIVLGGAWMARAPSSERRERAWEIQALGIGLLAIVWVAANRASGGL